MAGEPERSTQDISMARELAQQFAEQLLGSWLYSPEFAAELDDGFRDWQSQEHKRKWRFRLKRRLRYPTDLFARRYIYKGYWPRLPSRLALNICGQLFRTLEIDSRLGFEVWIESASEMDSALRLLQLSVAESSPNIFVIDVGENVFGALALVDGFNPRTRAAISPTTEQERRFGRGELLRWFLVASEQNTDVTLINIYQATKGFFELFIDSMQALRRAINGGYFSSVSFTVNANNRGYQVEYYPQYNYSPVVFGSTVTTPVVGTLQVGHYRFQGWKDGVVTPDRGLYFAGPASTSAQLRDF